MPHYLVELYVPRVGCDAAAAEAARFLRVAAALTPAGRTVRLLQSIVVPEDETCFLLVTADGAEDVRETVERAGLTVEHIAETAVETTTNERSTR